MTSAVINLITGVNGSGKTLYALSTIEAYRRAENTGVDKDGNPRSRPLYYWGIRGIREAGVLKDWIEIEPFDEHGKTLGLETPMAVHDLPTGSIVVIDEAHAAFPKTAMVTVKKDGRNELRPAPHVEAFATARWRGHTFFFITQYAKDLHPAIRERVGKYWHVRRNWGMERSVVYEWEEFVDAKSKGARKDATVIQFPFPKEVYGWYKSADQHNVRKVVPYGRLALIPIGLAAAGLLAWYAFHRLTPDWARKPAQDAQHASAAPMPQAASKPFDAKADGSRWASQWDERIEGIPYSAKLYDAAFKVASVPKISGCSWIKYVTAERTIDNCTCNTQQGTDVTSMSYAQCRYYVRHGWFDPTRPDRETLAREGGSQPPPSGEGGFTETVAGLAAAPAQATR